MKILLINPNRYHYPPVIPIGIEYLYGHLLKSNHEPDVLDLCFSDNPEIDIVNKIKDNCPDIIGISIRHIDTVLYQNNEFFIDDIKEYVGICKKMKLRVILGGIGFSIMPLEILSYTGADFGIYGPGELALIDMLNDLENAKAAKKLTDGFNTITANKFKSIRKRVIDYSSYIDKDGIVGFRTQIGCPDNCFFCTEGQTTVIHINPESVGQEICELKDEGYTYFHLCDSEFNLNLNHCIDICKAIVRYAGGINWTLYMKPEPFSADLFKWLKESGATLITLSIDTKTSGHESFQRLEQFLALADSRNIKIAVDLSIGYPYEKLHQTRAMLDFLQNQPVETIGVNSFYRVYPGTPLHHIINNDCKLEKYLINWKQGTNYLMPVFFNFFTLNQVKELIDGRSKFRIEGFDKNTNYQRIN